MIQWCTGSTSPLNLLAVKSLSVASTMPRGLLGAPLPAGAVGFSPADIGMAEVDPREGQRRAVGMERRDGSNRTSDFYPCTVCTSTD